MNRCIWALVLALCSCGGGEEQSGELADGGEDTQADAPSDADANADANAQADANADANAQADANANAQADADANAQADADAKSSDAAADSAPPVDTAPVSTDAAVDTRDAADTATWATAQHVHIMISNTCVVTVSPASFTVPAGEKLKLSYHNHSDSYEADVWMMYNGGYTELARQGTWNETYEHCFGPSPSQGWADISIAGGGSSACPKVRLPITCL